MQVIRKGVFETNSSSTHGFIININKINEVNQKEIVIKNIFTKSFLEHDEITQDTSSIISLIIVAILKQKYNYTIIDPFDYYSDSLEVENLGKIYLKDIKKAFFVIASDNFIDISSKLNYKSFVKKCLTKIEPYHKNKQRIINNINSIMLSEHFASEKAHNIITLANYVKIVLFANSNTYNNFIEFINHLGYSISPDNIIKDYENYDWYSDYILYVKGLNNIIDFIEYDKESDSFNECKIKDLINKKYFIDFYYQQSKDFSV